MKLHARCVIGMGAVVVSDVLPNVYPVARIEPIEKLIVGCLRGQVIIDSLISFDSCCGFRCAT